MIEYFLKGGTFMWPILVVFIIGLIFVIERLIHLIKSFDLFANRVNTKKKELELISPGIL